MRDDRARETTEVNAKFVFVGAGGGALHLLQKSGIAEGRGYGGFPVSGLFLAPPIRSWWTATTRRCTARPRRVLRRCRCPTWTPASSTARATCCSAPTPASRPSSSRAEASSTSRPPCAGTTSRSCSMLAKDNFDLVTYLMSQLAESKKGRFQALEEFTPEVRSGEVGPHHRRTASAGHEARSAEGRCPGLRHGGRLRSRRLDRRAAGAPRRVPRPSRRSCWACSSAASRSSTRAGSPASRTWSRRSVTRQLHEDESLLKEISDYSAGTLQIG